MALLRKFINQMKKKETLWHSVLLLSLLIIIFLIYRMSPLFATVVQRCFSLIKPFVIGFMLAYILNPLVERLMRLGLGRGLAMGIVYVACVILLFFLVGVLLPAIIANLSSLSANLMMTARIVNGELMNKYQIDATLLTETVIMSIRKLSDNLSVVENALGALSSALNYVTSSIIYLVISSYMLAGFSRIKAGMKKITRHIHPYFPSYLTSLDFYMNAFLKGMLTLMLIRLIEYGFMYLVIGHAYWKEMALLSAVTVFIPYVGPLFSCAIGVLTGFGLPVIQFIVMMLLLIILFFVDTYVILPDVYSKETNTHPIWILFAMVTGLNLFGLVGLLMAIPVFVAIRVAYLEIVFFKGESV